MLKFYLEIYIPLVLLFVVSLSKSNAPKQKGVKRDVFFVCRLPYLDQTDQSGLLGSFRLDMLNVFPSSTFFLVRYIALAMTTDKKAVDDSDLVMIMMMMMAFVFNLQ